MPSCLDLFQRQQVQTSILKTEEIAYKPLTSLESQSSIEFTVSGLNDTYLDLSSSTIRLKLQILDKNGDKKVITPTISQNNTTAAATPQTLEFKPPEELLRRKRTDKVKIYLPCKNPNCISL